MRTKELKRNKGITLIALVITIIVLLILAGVTIAILTGENGILTRATEANEKTLQGQVKEEIELMSTDYTGGKYTGGEENIKKYYQDQAAKGEISSIKDNGDGTYTISKDGYEVKIDEDGSVIDIQEKEEVAVTDVWYKIDGTTLHFSNSDLGGYSKHNPNYTLYPEWVESYQYYRPTITAVIFDNEIVPLKTAYWFNSCRELTEIQNIQYLNTSQVTNMSRMFTECMKLTNLDVSHFDTSNVTNMYMMFCNCQVLTELDVSGFDTSKVERNLEYMFSNCYVLTELDVSGFNTSNVKDMIGMFSGCKSLKSIDVSGFDIRNVEAIYGVFNGCESLETIDLSSWGTHKGKNLEFMFQNCKNLKKLDISNFDTSNVVSMRYMFNGCTSLEELNLKNFDTRKVTTAATKKDMFTNVTCPVYVGENWNLLESDTGYTGTFSK